MQRLEGGEGKALHSEGNTSNYDGLEHLCVTRKKEERGTKEGEGGREGPRRGREGGRERGTKEGEGGREGPRRGREGGRSEWVQYYSHVHGRISWLGGEDSPPPQYHIYKMYTSPKLYTLPHA